MTTPGDDPDIFEPLSNGSSAISESENEGSNVCRAAALAFLLRGASGAADGLANELRALGFSGSALETGNLAQTGRDAFRRLGSTNVQRGINLDSDRMRGWAAVNENADASGAATFLIAMLGSALERESAAAAAALWRGLRLRTQLAPQSLAARRRLYDHLTFGFDGRNDTLPMGLLWLGDWPNPDSEYEPVQSWEPDRWQSTYQQVSYRIGSGDNYIDAFVIATLALARLDQAVRSPDFVTRSLATAALLPDDDPTNSAVPQPANAPPSVETPMSPKTSTMIHGTWAFTGGWWRPRVGDFHQFISNRYRPNLYRGGAHFHWSGNYKDKHRAKAAEYFAEWVAEIAPEGLQSVFAHSYGGEVAARALNSGSAIQELVLLSTPVTDHVETAAQSPVRLIDIRLPFDPVLALELRPQRIPAGPDLTEVLTSWRLDHGATHKPSVWTADDIAQRGQIELTPDLVSGR